MLNRQFAHNHGFSRKSSSDTTNELTGETGSRDDLELNKGRAYELARKDSLRLRKDSCHLSDDEVEEPEMEQEEDLELLLQSEETRLLHLRSNSLSSNGSSNGSNNSSRGARRVLSAAIHASGSVGVGTSTNDSGVVSCISNSKSSTSSPSKAEPLSAIDLATVSATAIGGGGDTQSH